MANNRKFVNWAITAVLAGGVMLAGCQSSDKGESPAISRSGNMTVEKAYTAGTNQDQTQIQALISALTDSDVTVRCASAWALGEIGDKQAVEPLIQALSDKSFTMRDSAAIALGKIRDTRAIAPLFAINLHDNGNVKETAVVIALANIGIPAIEQLIPLYESANYTQRNVIKAVIEKIGISNFDLVTKILQKQNGEIADLAVSGFGKGNHPQKIELLKKIFTEYGGRGGDAAILALWENNYTETIDLILSTSYVLGHKSILVLGKSGDPRAADYLAGLLNTVYRDEVIDALLKNNDKKAIDALLANLVENHNKSRNDVAKKLKKINITKLTPEQQATYYVFTEQMDKALALKEYAVIPLTKAIKDTDQKLSQSAIEAIKKLDITGYPTEIQAYYFVALGRWPEAVALGDYSLEPLMQTLSDPNATTSSAGGEILLKLGSVCVTPLIEYAKKEIRYVNSGTYRDGVAIIVPEDEKQYLCQKNALNLLLKINEALIPNDRKAEFYVITRQWGKAVTQDQAAVVPLLEALGQKNKSHNQVILDSLKVIGIEKLTSEQQARYYVYSHDWEKANSFGVLAIEPMLDCIRDADSNLWKTIRDELVKIGPPAVDVLIDKLRNYLRYKNEESGATAIISALGQIGDIRAVEPLMVIVKNKNNDESTHQLAIRALGELKDQRAIVVLENSLTDNNPRIRIASAKALWRLGDEKGLAYLFATMDQSPSSRYGIIYEMSDMKDARVVDKLILMLNDKDINVCMIAVKSLGEIQDMQAIEPLTKLLDDSSNAGISEACRIALRKIETRKAENQ